MSKALSQHWPEYLMEAMGLGTFMLSACIFAVLLEHPGAVLHQALPDPLLRRLLMGLAMALTAVGIIYSPWGQQSGAHLNPAVTLEAVWQKNSNVIYLKIRLYRYDPVEIDKCIQAIYRTKNDN